MIFDINKLGTEIQLARQNDTCRRLLDNCDNLPKDMGEYDKMNDSYRLY